MNATLQPTTLPAGAALDRTGADALERNDSTLAGADDLSRQESLDPGLLETSGIQEAEAEADADPAAVLQASDEFNALPDNARALVTTALADSAEGGNFARDMLTLIRDLSFQALGQVQQRAAITDAALQQTPEFQALSAGDQRLVLEALSSRAPGDTGLPAAIQSLIQSPQFQDSTDFGAAERTALLSQVRNYPDSRSVENMENLLSKQWFRDFGVGDTQRALKTVAFLAQHDDGDLEIIQNTLDLFVAEGAPYRFDFSETGAYGSVPFSPTDLFRINPRFIGADNNTVNTSANSAEFGELRVIGHTFVHEVNHMQNWDRNLSLNSSYGFHEEYRAFWVGVKAQHGNDPSVADVIDRVAVFVNPGGGYAHLAELLSAGGRDAQEIAGYLNTILGRDDITMHNARSEVNALVQLMKDTQDAGRPLPEVLSRPAGITIGPPGTNNITNE
ncbi:MAG: hypothetical protein GX761_12260 [Gammaproteobacteria bacterium]|nr:hypothetical protein [Gammaproteobacteria bacterium]